MLRGWAGVLNAPGTSRGVQKNMNTMRISNIPEMESSVSVALSYSLSSESVEENDEFLGGSDCVSPQTEKAQGPLKGFTHTTALSAINTHKQKNSEPNNFP